MNLHLFIFEIYLLVALALFLILSITKRTTRFTWNTALIVGLGAVVLAGMGLKSVGVAWSGGFEVNFFTQIIKLIFSD